MRARPSAGGGAPTRRRRERPRPHLLAAQARSLEEQRQHDVWVDPKEKKAKQDLFNAKQVLDAARKVESEHKERMKALRSRGVLFDEQGNIFINQDDYRQRKRELRDTYFLFKAWRMPLKTYIKILLALLTIAVFVERYCFAVAVFSGRGYGYLLIVAVTLFNTIFLGVIAKLRTNK